MMNMKKTRFASVLLLLLASFFSVNQAFATPSQVVHPARRRAGLQISSLQVRGGAKKTNKPSLMTLGASAVTISGGGDEKKKKVSGSKVGVLQGLTFLVIFAVSMTSLAPPPALVAVMGPEKATARLSMVSGAGALTEIMFATVIGKLLDATGRKPAMVLIGLAVAATNGAVAMNSSVLNLCISKYVCMLCVGFFLLTSQTIISDMSTMEANQEKIKSGKNGNDKDATEKWVSSAMGVQMALMGVGFLMGIIGAGILSEKAGISAIFGASSALALLSSLCLAFFLPETLPRKQSGGKTGSKIEWKKLIASPLASAKLLYSYGPQVRTLSLLLMLMVFPTNQGDFLQIYAKTEWDLSTKSFSSYLALVGMVSIFANGLGSQLVKKMGVRKFTTLAILSRSLAAIGTAFFGFRGSVIGWIVGFLGAAQTIGIVAALMSAAAKSGLPQGECSGERAALLALLKVVGPLAYSFMYIQGTNRLGMNNLPFLFNIVLCAIALVIAQTSLKNHDDEPATSKTT